MPVVNVHRDLPALENILKNDEKIFNSKTDKYDLRIGLLNLMPTKPVTEEQFLRLIGNSKYNCQLDFIRLSSHISKNVDKEYLEKFYKDFEDIKEEKYDAFIITGAPVEQLEFSQVDYWESLKEVFSWIKKNDIASIYICWGAQAGLYYHYDVKKELYKEKIFGIYDHEIQTTNPLFKDIPTSIAIPQSRYTGIDVEQLSKVSNLVAVDSNDSIGSSIFVSEDSKEVFILGHLEYDTDTLEKEYLRDKDRGLATKKPACYYSNGKINNRWHENAKTFYKNWLELVAKNKK